MSARGTEPFWTARIDGRLITYASADGRNLMVMVPTPQVIANGYEWATEPITVRIANVPCTEASGESVPYTVQVILGTAPPVDGCGR